ncbi:MAG TPA: hypothetical protein VNU97_01310 [Rhizomicrobium sp.]|jgi:hypothetical protein|nr:hypothetical protein [Rhizomicrobium sp.]
MLNKMSLLLAATAVVVSAGAANADYYHRHHRAHVAFDINSVAFGYNDGYWDNGHSWHRWNNQNDYLGYRQHGTHYHAWSHNRDGDHGWQNH